MLVGWSFLSDQLMLFKYENETYYFFNDFFGCWYTASNMKYFEIWGEI